MQILLYVAFLQSQWQWIKRAIHNQFGIIACAYELGTRSTASPLHELISPICAARSWKPWPKPWFDEISPNWLHFSLFLFMFYFHISPGMSLLCSGLPFFLIFRGEKKAKRENQKSINFISCDPGRERERAKHALQKITVWFGVVAHCLHLLISVQCLPRTCRKIETDCTKNVNPLRIWASESEKRGKI